MVNREAFAFAYSAICARSFLFEHNLNSCFQPSFPSVGLGSPDVIGRVWAGAMERPVKAAALNRAVFVCPLFTLGPPDRTAERVSALLAVIGILQGPFPHRVFGSRYVALVKTVNGWKHPTAASQRACLSARAVAGLSLEFTSANNAGFDNHYSNSRVFFIAGEDTAVLGVLSIGPVWPGRAGRWRNRRS